jgi:putative FmdB family regulatory protein
MPLYEYQCEACDHRFEVIQKFSDAPLETCPKCAGAVRKLLSSPAFHFKGSGWYITDYARAGKGGEAAEGGKGNSSGESKTTGGESKSDAGSESKSESKTDSSSETKAESKTASTTESKTESKTP